MTEPFHKFYERVCEARPDARVIIGEFRLEVLARDWFWVNVDDDRDIHQTQNRLPEYSEIEARALCLRHWLTLDDVDAKVLIQDSHRGNCTATTFDKCGSSANLTDWHSPLEEALGAWLIGSRG